MSSYDEAYIKDFNIALSKARELGHYNGQAISLVEILPPVNKNGKYRQYNKFKLTNGEIGIIRHDNVLKTLTKYKHIAPLKVPGFKAKIYGYDPYGTPLTKTLFNQLINTSGRGGREGFLPTKLTPKQFLKILDKYNWKSVHSGLPLSFDPILAPGTYMASADRIDGDLKQYSKDNVWPCTGIENMMRMCLTPEEFYDWIAAIHNHQLSKSKLLYRPSTIK